MPLFLVLRAGTPSQVVEADDPETAWQQARSAWADASAVVPLEEPVVRATLLAHVYPRDEPSTPAPAPGWWLRIWVDGSSLGNPGPVGWAFVRSDGEEGSGPMGRSTNNAAELTAVLRALESVDRGVRITVHTDSRNVIGWLSQGWKRNDPGVQELAGAIDRLCQEKGVRMRLQHVAGHSGEPGNERAHQLATKAARQPTAG